MDWAELKHDHVFDPTIGDNMLDLVFTSERAMVDNSYVWEHFSNDDDHDHNLITLENFVNTNEII